MDNEQKEFTNNDLTNAEDNAIIKYEKGAKHYRPKKYVRTGEFITCLKCGSQMNLTKTTVDGKDYWFCKNCIIERANELQAKKGKVIPERE